MKKVKVFLFNGILLTSVSLLISTIGVSFNVYITNKIGSQAIGIYQLIMSIYMFCITVAISGIGLASTRIVAEEIALSNESGAKKAILKCILFSAIFGIISCVILYLSAPYIVKFWLHDKISTKALYIIAISLPFLSMSSALNGYFTALRRIIKSASAQILEQFIKIFITLYLLNLLMPPGLENACLALVIGTCISEICSFSYLFILYNIDKKKLSKKSIVNTKYMKKILNISLPIAFTSYIRAGLSTFKQIITPIQLEKSGMNCDVALSNYGMISGMVFPILLFPSAFITSFSNLLMPEIARFYALNNMNKINNVIISIFKPTLIFSICVIGIFLTFATQLSVLLYNNLEIVKYILVLCPLILVMYIDSIVDSILKGINEQVSVMKYNIIDLIVSICCIYFLLPYFGINGYIIAIIASECTNTFLSTLKLLKKTQFKIDYKNWIIKPICCMILSLNASKLIGLNFENTIFNLIIRIFILSFFIFNILY
ncbi:MAG: oligosaccharide flippase family protein [Clostridia bacterium]